jgi:hypothetical protein
MQPRCQGYLGATFRVHRNVAVGIRDGSRGFPLDGVEDARPPTDRFEAMPPAVIRGDIRVRHDSPREPTTA